MSRPNPVPTNAQMLTAVQVADILNVSKMSVYRRIADGDLKAYKFGRTYRVHQGDLNDFLADASTDSGMSA